MGRNGAGAVEVEMVNLLKAVITVMMEKTADLAAYMFLDS